MIRSLSISKSGLEAQQLQLDVISNNLANINTNGFKRVRAVFEDLLYQTLRQPGANSSQATLVPTGLQIGAGSRVVGTVRNFTQGALTATGNALDLAINGAGFFGITLPDGTVGYTRDGSFSLNEQGQLVTTNGFPLSPPINVPQGATSVTVAPNGVVTAEVNGALAQVGNLQVFSFINPAGLVARGQNILLETLASGPPIGGEPGINGLGTLSQAFVENSTVNVAEELINLISAQRSFEIASRAVSTSDQILQRLGQL